MAAQRQLKPYDAVAEARKECRRQVRLAVQQGRTLPYSLSTLIDAGVGVVAIRKVYRNQ